jgi:hypothetical protein
MKRLKPHESNSRIFLGVLHLFVALILLPATSFFGLVILPVFLPVIIWLAILGIRILRPYRKVRKALLVTHSALVPIAVLLVFYGLYCLRAAQRSAEAGGGLLGAVGLIPIVMGALMGILAVVSLFFAFTHKFRQ